MADSPLILDIAFWLIYIFTPIAGLAILRNANIDLLKFSIPSIFFAYYMVLGFLGALPLFYGWFDFPLFIGVTDPYLVFLVLWYSSLSILLILLSFNVTYRATKHNNTPSFSYQPLKAKTIFFICIIMALCIIAEISYISANKQVAAITALSDVASARMERSEMTNAFAGKYHWYVLIFDAIIPFCVYVLLGQALLRKRAASWFLLAGSFLIALILQIQDLQKAPALWLILGCYLSYQYITRKRYNLKSLFAVFITLFLVMGLIVGIFVGVTSEGIGEIYVMAMQRILNGGVLPAYFHLVMFADSGKYLMGQSLPNPMHIFPWEPYSLPVEVMYYMYPKLSATNVIGSAPAVYWAELYANFGPFGLILAAPIIGFLIAKLYLSLEALRNSPAKVAFVVWTALYLMKLAESGVSIYLLNLKLIVVFLCYKLICFIDKGSTFPEKQKILYGY